MTLIVWFSVETIHYWIMVTKRVLLLEAIYLFQDNFMSCETTFPNSWKICLKRVKTVSAFAASWNHYVAKLWNSTKGAPWKHILGTVKWTFQINIGAKLSYKNAFPRASLFLRTRGTTSRNVCIILYIMMCSVRRYTK